MELLQFKVSDRLEEELLSGVGGLVRGVNGWWLRTRAHTGVIGCEVVLIIIGLVILFCLMTRNSGVFHALAWGKMGLFAQHVGRRCMGPVCGKLHVLMLPVMY